MKSVKLFELMVFAFLASLFILVTGAWAQTDSSFLAGYSEPAMVPTPVDPPNAPTMPQQSDFKNKLLYVESADVPSTANRTDLVKISLVVEYSDTCKHIFLPFVEHHLDGLVEVRPAAQTPQSQGQKCAQVMVPKQEEVTLGVLRDGQNTVRIYRANGGVIERSLFIK